MTPLSPLSSMGNENAKSAFTYIAINQRLTEFFQTFFAIFLFSVLKCCIFAPAIEKKASLVPKVGLYRRHIQVLIDVRRRTSITTQIRARNGALG